MAEAAGLRLWPLNPDRVVVAKSLTRAALALGHTKVHFHGIHGEEQRFLFSILKFASIVLYFFKRVLLKFAVR